jgi:hypothetical protein
MQIETAKKIHNEDVHKFYTFASIFAIIKSWKNGEAGV